MNDPAIRTDRDLFEAASAGDAQAFAELTGRHARGLYDFALRGTLDQQQAEAVILAAFRRIREPVTDVPAQIDVRTWLYSLGLVEVLAVANETRTARISTDDERFFRPTSDVDSEIAHWAWQAARGLRTRDYCVLDLTLRRGLTPEEVAEAASLTRSNLYASIGRARGAFEETFAAMLLFEHGRDGCAELDEMVEMAPGTSLRPALRHQIIEHADTCDACRRTLDALPPAAAVYVSLADIEVPNGLTRRAGTGMSGLSISGSLAQESPPELGSPATAGAFATGAASLDSPLPAEPDDDDAWDDEAADEDDDAARDEAGEPSEEDDLEGEIDEQEEAASLGFPQRPRVEPVAVAPVLARGPDARPVSPIRREEPGDEYDAAIGDVVTTWLDRARGQPMMWTYALLGILAVIAIYLGVAVADSLESGGRDSGAVPLDAPPGTTSGRVIDCGVPIELEAGTPHLVTFDETALEGFRIGDVSVFPLSADTSEDDLTVTPEGAFAIRFDAAEQEPTRAHTDEFEMRIQWQRNDETARSSCEVRVQVPG